MILGWESENFTKKLISSANLTTKDGVPGLKGTYYRNKNLKSTKIEKPVIRISKNLKPKYFNERYFIKDRDGTILKKSENLNQLINKMSWNKLRIIK